MKYKVGQTLIWTGSNGCNWDHNKEYKILLVSSDYCYVETKTELKYCFHIRSINPKFILLDTKTSNIPNWF
jgi:hypothetical protein